MKSAEQWIDELQLESHPEGGDNPRSIERWTQSAV